MKKLLSIVLAVAMLVCMLPAAAFAGEETYWEGSYLAIADTKSLGDETATLSRPRSYNDIEGTPQSTVAFDIFAEKFMEVRTVTAQEQSQRHTYDTDRIYDQSVRSYVAKNVALSSNSNLLSAINEASLITYDMGFGDLYWDENNTSYFFNEFAKILKGNSTFNYKNELAKFTGEDLTKANKQAIAFQEQIKAMLPDGLVTGQMTQKVIELATIVYLRNTVTFDKNIASILANKNDTSKLVVVGLPIKEDSLTVNYDIQPIDVLKEKHNGKQITIFKDEDINIEVSALYNFLANAINEYRKNTSAYADQFYYADCSLAKLFNARYYSLDSALNGFEFGLDFARKGEAVKAVIDSNFQFAAKDYNARILDKTAIQLIADTSYELHHASYDIANQIYYLAQEQVEILVDAAEVEVVKAVTAGELIRDRLKVKTSKLDVAKEVLVDVVFHNNDEKVAEAYNTLKNNKAAVKENLRTNLIELGIAVTDLIGDIFEKMPSHDDLPSKFFGR